MREIATLKMRHALGILFLKYRNSIEQEISSLLGPKSTYRNTARYIGREEHGDLTKFILFQGVFGPFPM